MRALEFLLENYEQQLEAELTNLLIAAKGNGASEVNTQDVVNQLQKMGYSVNSDALLPILQNSPIAANSTPDSISLSGGEPMQDDGEDSAAKVGDMAQKATKLG